MKEMLDWIDVNIHFPITDPTWIFFLVLVIILFAPIVLERLRIPHIIGMILAGVVIGEHGLNILARDSSFELFGKVGLYYIMFLAGLEMNMEDFKSIRVKATVLGLLAFIFPLGIGIWTNLHILGYGLITSVLLASMYASHTLIAYPIVIRYGINRQRAVGIAVGGTAVTDTLTLLVLAVVGGMFKGDTSGMFWVWLVLKVIVLSMVIMYTFPRIGRWFFRRYSDNVVQYIFVMAMVFLGAGLMEVVGMEGILGAFLAGLVLNRLIPHVSPLMSHLEFVGNALFIPYFLIGVGMLINVNVLFGHIDSLKVAGVMIVVALVGKWIASWLMNGTILLILVTCVVSSFITEHAAKQIVTDEAELDEGKANEKERFLIPLSNPDTLEDLISLGLVVRNPKQLDNLVALNVINDSNDSVRLEMRGRRNLERAAQIAASANVSMRTVSRFDLNIATGILHAAKEYDVTSIIIGLHRKTNIVDSFFGTLAENLLKKYYQQVMIARFQMPVNTLRRILVAVPPKAEYEHGFVKWVSHLCRMSGELGCRLHFFAHPQTLGYLKGCIRKLHKEVLAEYQELENWEDLLIITGQVNFDHLLVIVSSRRGSISYDSAFERLPGQISKYFNTCSIMVLYPDQMGDPNEQLTFSDPHGYAESQLYDKVRNRLYKWFKKEA